MERLPKEEWMIEMSRDGKHIMASLYTHPDNVRYWFSYNLSDLPNNDISREDLERFGIGNFINKVTI